MQFKVPQFIDIEDKIFGPFTFAQFAYLVGGAGIVFVFYKLLPFWIALFIILPVAGLTIGLVFVKINTKPFIYYLQAAFSYFVSNKLYIWKQRLIKKGGQEEENIITTTKVSSVPIVSENRLKSLSWSLDVEDKGVEKEDKLDRYK